MIQIRKVEKGEKNLINDVVKIHLDTFKGFFLTFLGKGFLRLLYKSYVTHNESDLIIAVENDEVVGFVAYSGDSSGLYKYMVKTKLIAFAWYSLGAFIRKPKVFMRLLRAFNKKDEVKREEKYIELASIGVLPKYKSQGIGSTLINELKEKTNYNKYAYINLETDTENNDVANYFYKKNGFVLYRTYETREGRKMNEYRFYKENYLWKCYIF